MAFVDVPGHQRFLPNTLAGLGPAPVVCFVVAADEGWQAQSSDHRDVIAALGIARGVIVITKVDRAPQRADEVLTQARAELARTGLADAPAVAVSALTGAGLPQLRATLDNVLQAVPVPDATARLRLWVDRSFSITGAGTVVTGTLTAGTISRGDTLELIGSRQNRTVTVRGLQSRGEPEACLGPVTRVAVNLRGIAHEDIRRGDVLVTPGSWPTTRMVDVRRTTGTPLTEAPHALVVHAGTAAVPAAVRPLGDEHARLTLDRRLPLVFGDPLVLRGPGGHGVIAGARILDADPPVLRRRGDGARRASALAGMGTEHDVATEVARRGAVTHEHLVRLGLVGPTTAPPPDVVARAGWWVHAATYDGWNQRLIASVHELRARDPLSAGLSQRAASARLALPDEALVEPIARDAGLEQSGGYLRLPHTRDGLGPAEPAIAELESRLRSAPFAAPEADALTAMALGSRELAAAERAGRVLRLRDGVVLLPTAPALAMRTLAGLEQPFTTSQARQALQTSRRVVIPLLEHLDARGWTRRLDAGHRAVVR